MTTRLPEQLQQLLLLHGSPNIGLLDGQGGGAGGDDGARREVTADEALRGPGRAVFQELALASTPISALHARLGEDAKSAYLEMYMHPTAQVVDVADADEGDESNEVRLVQGLGRLFCRTLDRLLLLPTPAPDTAVSTAAATNAAAQAAPAAPLACARRLMTAMRAAPRTYAVTELMAASLMLLGVIGRAGVDSLFHPASSHQRDAARRWLRAATDVVVLRTMLDAASARDGNLRRLLDTPLAARYAALSQRQVFDKILKKTAKALAPMQVVASFLEAAAVVADYA